MAALVLAGCAALSACGTTGSTTRFVLPLDLPARPKVAAFVQVASAAMEADAAYLNPLNVQPWGQFGPEDLKNIEQSLQDTIVPHLAPASPAAHSGMDLHVVVRRYVVSTSNTAGAVLACVAWAATSPQGSLIYEEQFYAADKSSRSFEEAVSWLPRTMVSMGNPSLAAFPDRTVSVVGLLTPSGVSTVEWKVASPSAAFDWAGYLARLYRR